MKIFILAATLLPLLTSVAAQGQPRYAGCYRTPGALTRTTSDRNSCAETCADAGNSTIGALTRISECYCGTTVPRDEDRVPNENCDANCPGAPQLSCGSNAGDFYSVYYFSGGPSPSSGSNNGTISTTRAGNRTSTSSSGTRTSTAGGGGGSGATTSGGSAPTNTGSRGDSAPSATSSAAGSSSSGNIVHIGGGMLVGAVVMGVLAMVF
ncbi:hypothetical protein HOY80DRAFT_224260 [Tuber brumale]|nr:hypothetical protein HOY80DRAFT_224260 [Tuber brumale]